MKKLTFIIPVLLSAILAGCTTGKEADLYQMLKQSRDSLHYYKAISNQMQKDLHSYEVYRNATETLLDSLGIDEDAPILETAAGSDYLNAVNELQNVQSSTSYN